MPGKSVVVKVVSGQVLIKLAGRGRARATGPAKGFVPFTGAANIPVGSQLDTSKGRVALTSAADTGGAKTQTSHFYEGIFQVKQSVPEEEAQEGQGAGHRSGDEGSDRAVAVRAVEGRARRRGDQEEEEARRRCSGKLWGNGKGKFRTNGKYSAATVRGTIWLVEDRCEGTLTKVTRGTVSVRDFKRKKTVTVKAGPQLPGARPAGRQQGQAAAIAPRRTAGEGVTPGT